MSRFAALFDDIRAGAVERERERRLPFAEIAALRDAGFTALRVPTALGGSGASLPELFALFIELGAADPNVLQALRGHFGFVERLLIGGTQRERDWLRRIAGGALVGNAQAEGGGATRIDTRLERAGDAWYLTGRKFYTTGTLYADWTWSTALDHEGRPHGVVVPTSPAEVTVIDDWAGFGQRLTGSGTTVFDRVRLEERSIRYVRNRGGGRSTIASSSTCFCRRPSPVSASPRVMMRSASYAPAHAPSASPVRVSHGTIRAYRQS